MFSSRVRLSLLTIMAGAMVSLGAACGAPAAQPTPAVAPPTLAPAAQPAASPSSIAAAATSAAPTSMAVPTASADPSAVASAAAAKPAASPPSGGPPSASASPAAAGGAVPAGGTRLTIDPSASEARFAAREIFAGQPATSDAIGATREVAGQITLAPNGAIQDGSRITVNLASLKSDRDQRDNFIKRNTLQTSQFPNAEFVPRQVQGLTGALPTSGQATFQLLGDLTVRGVTKPATWDVTATFSPQDVSGKATTTIRLDTFGMQKPSVPIIASIEDDIRLELDFTAQRAS